MEVGSAVVALIRGRAAVVAMMVVAVVVVAVELHAERLRQVDEERPARRSRKGHLNVLLIREMKVTIAYTNSV